MIQQAMAAIEAILFSLGEAVSLEQIAEAIAQDKETTRKLITTLKDRYQGEEYGIQIIEVEDRYQLCTKKEMYEYLIRLMNIPQKQELTDVQLEILSIIAYRQPVTRLEIEKIRGVKSDKALNRLIEFELVEEVGRKQTPGRPILFGVTDQFLRRFGIRSLGELPMPDIEDMEEIREEAQDEVGLHVEI